MALAVVTNAVERFFGEDDIIVSKTDTNGRITYANRTFLDIAGYYEREVLGAAHSIIRHRDMPRTVFHLLWETIASGREIFAYVVNRTKDDAFYWVFAHVTPTFDANGRISGYHSNRRVPNRESVDRIRPIYAKLLEIEAGAPSKTAASTLGRQWLAEHLERERTTYDELVFSI
ncbi:MAG: PAS domain-containing protein [Myxococcales bacterium]|nr:PAS domain-containing protein [Myxococcales bacterium]MCB9582760.1 PAS domain-containing protein [Polyangiaceae bacterium]